MTNRTMKNIPRRRRGFTLPELLVVISIIILLVSVALPGIKGMVTGQRVNSVIDAISSVARTARAESLIAPEMINSDYAGTAVLFTPQNEMRIVKHQDSTRFVDANSQLLKGVFHAYKDLPNAPSVTMAREVGVVGITRSRRGEVLLLAPPFAIHFNRSGNQVCTSYSYAAEDKGLVAETNALVEDLIFYNGDYDRNTLQGSTSAVPLDRIAATFVNNRAAVQFHRNKPINGGEYNPDKWFPFDPDYAKSAMDGDEDVLQPGKLFTTRPKPNWPKNLNEGKYKLPFEAIEAVMGIIVYNRQELRKANIALDASGVEGGLDANARKWLIGDGSSDNTGNGQTIFFNHYTGAGIK